MASHHTAGIPEQRRFSVRCALLQCLYYFQAFGGEKLRERRIEGGIVIDDQDVQLLAFASRPS